MSTIPKELIKAVKKGECVLFVGAGVSTEAGLPGGWELAKALAEAMGRQYNNEPLAKMAQFYQTRNGRPMLLRFLKDKLKPAVDFTDKSTCPSYRLIARLPFKLILTTNFDSLIEDMLRSEGMQPNVINFDQDITSYEPDTAQVLKVHGDFSQAKMVVTTDDYDNYYRDFPRLLDEMKSIFAKHTVIFIGYGLEDVNFRAIHARVRNDLGQFAQKAYAVLGPGFDRDAAESWRQKAVEVIPLYAKDFFAELNYHINLADAIELADRFIIAREAEHNRLYVWKALHDFLQDSQQVELKQWRKFNEFLSEGLRELAQEIEYLRITEAHDGGLAVSAESSLLEGIADSTARKHLEDCLDRVARCLDTLMRKQLAIDQALVRSQPVDYHISSLRGHVREHLDVSARALEEMKNGLRSSSEELWDNFKRIEDRFGDSDQVESFAKLKDLVEEMQRFIDNESRLVEWMDLHARFRKLELWLPNLKSAATQPQVATMGLFFAINEAWKCYKREAFHNIVQFKETIEYINEAEGWITELQEKGEGIETKLEKIDSTLRSIEAAPTEKLESQLRPSVKELQGLIQDFGKLVEEHFMSTDDKLKATAKNLKKLFPVLQKSPLLKEQS